MPEPEPGSPAADEGPAVVLDKKEEDKQKKELDDLFAEMMGDSTAKPADSAAPAVSAAPSASAP
jgi:hypothetical protein